MNYLVILSPDAQRDILSSRAWYLSESFELAARFESDLWRSLEKIESQPYAYRLVRRKVRRAFLRHFPYAIYFELTGNLVRVTAVLHQRRNDAL
jgi:plasmid stabilization system protein ParE